MKTLTRIAGTLLMMSCLIFSSLPTRAGASTLPNLKTVFIIVLENQDWRNIQNSTNAPYMNTMLLPMCSYCAQYYNPTGVHPSLGNYIWLEAGTNFGILNDYNPSVDHLSTTNHLVTLLNNAGVSWKAYEEDIAGDSIPLVNDNGYAVRHDPFVYFDDVTGTNDPDWSYGVAHIRPYSELAGDLASNNVAQYNFITPNICDDGHDTCAPFFNNIYQADLWLSTEIPKITNSAAYQNNGVIFITWDENNYDTQPVGLLALSPLAKGGGYTSIIHCTHSSTLRTVQEIFGVTPLLGDAANAADLSDLFVPPAGTNINVTPAGFGVRGCVRKASGAFQFTVTGAAPGKTNLVQASQDLTTWVCVSTNVPNTDNFTFSDAAATNCSSRFYRVIQLH